MGVAARPEIEELEEEKRSLMIMIRVNPAEAKPLLAKLAKILGEEDAFIINAKAEMIRATRKAS